MKSCMHACKYLGLSLHDGHTEDHEGKQDTSFLEMQQGATCLGGLACLHIAFLIGHLHLKASPFRFTAW